MKITKFHERIPECDEKPWKCKHKTCELWALGYGVSMRKILGIKFLVWKPPTVLDN